MAKSGEKDTTNMEGVKGLCERELTKITNQRLNPHKHRTLVRSQEWTQSRKNLSTIKINTIKYK